jgi:hypothetical protein
MSRSIVRRLTAAIALLAVLCLAMPVSAATSRPHATKAPAVAGSDLVDQLLAWLGSFWSGPEAQGQKVPTKALATSSGSSLLLPLNNTDRGGMIDPNGGS